MDSMDSLTFSSTPADVDWDALKAALVADDFDNLRTPDQYRESHERSHAVVVVRAADGGYVGNGRILSDGVCNAYLVDIWTATPYRRRGVGAAIVQRLLDTVPGQHVGLFTDDRQDFYRTIGFEIQPDGMSHVVGTWLNR